MDLYKRSENVVEMELHRIHSLPHGESCSDSVQLNSSRKNSSTMPHDRKLIYTLINSKGRAVECPLRNNYLVPELRQENGKLIMDKCESGKSVESFSRVSLGAEPNKTVFNFYSHCDGQTSKLIACK